MWKNEKNRLARKGREILVTVERLFMWGKAVILLGTTVIIMSCNLQLSL